MNLSIDEYTPETTEERARRAGSEAVAIPLPSLAWVIGIGIFVVAFFGGKL